MKIILWDKEDRKVLSITNMDMSIEKLGNKQCFVFRNETEPTLVFETSRMNIIEVERVE